MPARARTVLATALVAVLVGLGPWMLGWLEPFEIITYDMRQRGFAIPAPADSQIRLILVDDLSLEKMGEANPDIGQRWPRAFYAEIFDYCRKAGARGVISDVDFQGQLYDADDDKELAAALAGVVMALRLDPVKGQSNWPDWLDSRKRFSVQGMQPSGPALRASFSNEDVMKGVDVAFGHVEPSKDSDGIARRSRALLEFDGEAVPQLGLAALALGQPLRVENGSLLVAGRSIALDAEGRFPLRFRRPSGPGEHLYPAVSAMAVLNSADLVREGKPPIVAPEWFRDRYVFFGFSAEALFDNAPTPMDKTTPGVEVHATVLDNILNRRWLEAAPAWAVGLVTGLLALLSVSLTLRFARLRGSFLCAAILLPVPAAAGALAFRAGLVWPIVGPTLTTALALLGGASVNYFTEGKQRRYIRQAFNEYLTDMTDTILDEQGTLDKYEGGLLAKGLSLFLPKKFGDWKRGKVTIDTGSWGSGEHAMQWNQARCKYVSPDGRLKLDATVSTSPQQIQGSRKMAKMYMNEQMVKMMSNDPNTTIEAINADDWIGWAVSQRGRNATLISMAKNVMLSVRINSDDLSVLKKFWEVFDRKGCAAANK